MHALIRDMSHAREEGIDFYTLRTVHWQHNSNVVPPSPTIYHSILGFPVLVFCALCDYALSLSLVAALSEKRVLASPTSSDSRMYILFCVRALQT